LLFLLSSFSTKAHAMFSSETSVHIPRRLVLASAPDRQLVLLVSIFVPARPPASRPHLFPRPTRAPNPPPGLGLFVQYKVLVTTRPWVAPESSSHVKLIEGTTYNCVSSVTTRCIQQANNIKKVNLFSEASRVETSRLPHCLQKVVSLTR
jgi:hypothetical protein